MGARLFLVDQMEAFKVTWSVEGSAGLAYVRSLSAPYWLWEAGGVLHVRVGDWKAKEGKFSTVYRHTTRRPWPWPWQ